MSRRERLQQRMRPVVRWLYLATGALVLPLVLEGLLEQVGVLRPPVEGAIPEPIHIGLLFAALAAGGLIFLAWPLAIAVVWLYGREWALVTPALLFLVADASFAVYLLVAPGSDTMFVVSGALMGVYGIAAVRAWARGRPRSHRSRGALVAVALLVAGSCTSVPERQTWISEMYTSPLALPGTEMIVLEGTVPPRNPEIFIVGRDGSGLHNLTEDPGEDALPVVSPDGRWILFLSDRDGAEGLYRMAADGSGVTRLSDRVSGLSHFGWIPGTDDVVYTGRAGIMITAADGSGDPRVFVADAGDPLWSPDGRWMLYQGGPRHTELHAIAADGSGDRKLADAWAITWLPDASGLLYHVTGSRDALSDVYRVGLDGSGRERILADVLLSGRSGDPAQSWSPDGARFALPAAGVGGFRPKDGIVILDRAGKVVRDHRKAQWYVHDGTLGWLDERTVVFSKLYNPPGIESELRHDPGGVYLLDVESGEETQIVRNAEIRVDPDHPPW